MTGNSNSKLEQPYSEEYLADLRKHLEGLREKCVPGLYWSEEEAWGEKSIVGSEII